MREELKVFVEKNLMRNGSQVGYDDELLLAGIIDSLGVTRLIAFVESEFDVRVPARDVTIENFRTISVLAEYLSTKKAEA